MDRECYIDVRPKTDDAFDLEPPLDSGIGIFIGGLGTFRDDDFAISFSHGFGGFKYR